jgi:hypothetical protein
MMRLLEGVDEFPILRILHQLFFQIGKEGRKRSIDTFVVNQMIAQRSWSCVGARLDLRFVLGLVVQVDSIDHFVSQSCSPNLQTKILFQYLRLLATGDLY